MPSPVRGALPFWRICGEVADVATKLDPPPPPPPPEMKLSHRAPDPPPPPPA